MQDYTDILERSLADPQQLFEAALTMRRRHKGHIVTFSKKAFVNIINLCRDSCSYCTYKSEPGQAKLSMMSPDDIRRIMGAASKYRCIEALLVTGERPEERYSEARRWLESHGFSSTTELLVHASEEALQHGLLPHTNAGSLEYGELRQLARTNPSMGLMLESSSERLMQEGMAHHLAPSKKPSERLRVLADAGRLGIPMTTGILVGIGETYTELVESLAAIKDIHDRYGNIQEVIMQNFVPKPDTRMRSSPAAHRRYFEVTVALARLMMPEMNIQAPPNLSDSYQNLLRIGINDWGGVSPLTPDYVNPESAWPAIDMLATKSKEAGFELRCRFPVYPEFVDMTGRRLQEMISGMVDDAGLVRTELWA